MKRKFIIATFFSTFLLISTNVKAVNFTNNQIVDANKIWTIKFTDEVGLDGITKQGITVTDSKGSAINVGIKLGQDNKTILVTAPEGGYTSGNNYTLTIGKAVHNKNGKQMKQDRSINFSITSKNTTSSLTIMTNANYDTPNYFSEGLAAVHNTNGISYIDTNGKVKIGPIKNWIFKVFDGIKMVNVSIKEEVRYATNFHEGLAFIQDFDSSGLANQIIIDKEGNEVFQLCEIGNAIFIPSYTYMDGVAIGMDPIQDGTMVSVFDKTGKSTKLDMKKIWGKDYWGVSDYAEGLLSFDIHTSDRLKGKWGYVDVQSKEVVIKPQFEDCRKFNRGIAPVKLNGMWGFIDKEGNFIINPQYEDFGVSDSDYSYQVFNNNGIASVKKNGKWGIIDKSGKVIIDFKYDNALEFSNEMAVVKENGKYGYIDISGKEIIVPQYDDANYFNKDIALVGKNGTYYLIDKNNNKVSSETWNFEGTSMGIQNPDVVFYKQNGKWGLAKINY